MLVLKSSSQDAFAIASEHTGAAADSGPETTTAGCPNDRAGRGAAAHLSHGGGGAGQAGHPPAPVAGDHA